MPEWVYVVLSAALIAATTAPSAARGRHGAAPVIAAG